MWIQNRKRKRFTGNVGMIDRGSILIWYEITDWSQRIQDIMSDVITPAVIEAVRSEPPKYCHWEDLTWLENALAMAGVNTKASVIDILADRLPMIYSCVRAYHACRTTNIESYYKDGFLPAVPQALNDLAEIYFLRPPKITREILYQAIQVAEKGHRSGNIFFSLDDRNLTKFCSSYLTWGSEYLAIIAHELQRRTDENCPAVLNTIGTPTIFICDLPIENITPSVQEFSGRLVEHLFEEFIRPQGEVPVIDFTFSISAPLPPDIIVSDYHP